MKRRIFLDTNIVIDYLAKRMPFAEDALSVFTKSTIPVLTPSELLKTPYWFNDDSDKGMLNEP